jgi:uncharacterized membrane protein
MATMQDYERISVIREIKARAKAKRHDKTYELSCGKDYYRKAIGSIHLCGVWTILSATLVLIATVAYTIIDHIQNANLYQNMDVAYIIGYVIGLALIFVLPFLFGIKLARLEITPTFALVSLIITLLFNLFFAVGIVPVISLIINIMALARWSTYKDWFNRLKIKTKE